jgi:hypothetical protein
LVLPKLVQSAFLEDCLVDLLVASLGEDLSQLASREDAVGFVTRKMKSLVTGLDALVASGATDRIVTKLLLFSTSKSIPTDRLLSKLVKQAQMSDKYKVPLVTLYHKDKQPHLVFRLPEISAKDNNSLKHLEGILTLMHYCTGVKVEHMSYHQDKELGTSLLFEGVHNKLIDELTSSASLPSGAYPGEVVTIGNYKCNFPTMLASIYFLNKKQQFLRKLKKVKKTEIKSISSFELKDLFNKRAGLTDKSKSYPTQLFKSCLSVICSVNNRIFPGGWISSNRLINGVKGDNGLLFKMGYKELVPYDHKLQAVITTDVSLNPKGHRILRNKSDISEYPEFSFLEFRSGVCLTSPRISQSSLQSKDAQRKLEPMSIRNDLVLTAFNDPRYHGTIDSLDKAHAMLLSCSNTASKTKAIHYEIARNEFLHKSARCPIKNGFGNELTKISDLDSPTLDYLRKLYRFKSKSKRDLEEATSETEMEGVESEHPQKKAKVAGKGKNSSSGVQLTEKDSLRRKPRVTIPPKTKS